MYRAGLETFGFHVVVAGDSAALFRAVDTRLPDLIVLDWFLPGMKGDEVLHEIRLDPRTRAVPVLMLSAFPKPIDGAVDRVFMAGALAWLEKSKTPPRRLAEKLIEAFRSTRSLSTGGSASVDGHQHPAHEPQREADLDGQNQPRQ